MTEIFLAGASEIPELVRLRLAYFGEEFGQIPPEILSRINTHLPLHFSAHLNKDCFCIVARDIRSGRIPACTVLCCREIPANPRFPDGKGGYVLGVYTEPEYRRQGIATGLMQRLLAEAKRLGLNRVELSASEMGKPIYEKLGFAVSHSHFTEMETEIQ